MFGGQNLSMAALRPQVGKIRARFLVELIGLNEFEKAINQLNESENESAAEARSSKIPYELYRYSDAGRFFLRPS